MRTVIHNEDLHADYLVVGLPGIGRVGHIAASYILNKMDHELVADIYSEHFPHQVIIEKGGILRLVRNQLYYVRAETPFFVLTGDSQSVGTAPPGFYEYARQIVDLAKDFGVKKFYTLAGLDRGPERLESEPGVVVAGTDEEIVRNFKEIGAKLDDAGTISGAAGLVLGIGALDGLRGACLMGETSAQFTMHGDPGAALAVIRMLSKYLGFDLDISELEKAAEGFETLLAPLKEDEPPHSDYIR